MAGLGGLSGIAGGYGEGLQQFNQNQLDQFKLQDFQLDRAGDQALGRTFQALGAAPQGMLGPASPGMRGQPSGPVGGVPMPPGAGAPPQQQQAQSPPPQQQAPPSGPMGERWPAVPMGAGNQLLGRAMASPPQGTVLNPGQPRQAMAQAQTPPPEMPQIPPRQPPQGPPPGGGNMPQPQGQFDLNTAASAIAKANPGIRPEVLVHALARAMPYLNAQAQNEVKQAMLQMREYGLMQRDEALRQGQDRVSQTQEKMQQQQQQFEEKQKQAEEKIQLERDKEARRNAQNTIKNSMANQQFEFKKQKAMADRDFKTAKAIADEQFKFFQTQINAQFSGMKDEDRKTLINEAKEARDKFVGAVQAADPAPTRRLNPDTGRFEEIRQGEGGTVTGPRG